MLRVFFSSLLFLASTDFFPPLYFSDFEAISSAFQAMQSETRNRLITLHRLLSPHANNNNSSNGHADDFGSFKECFTVFRGLSSRPVATIPSDPVATANRLKRLLPQSSLAEVLNSEAEGRRLDSLIEELQRGGCPKIPECLEFLRTLTAYDAVTIGDGLWNSAGDGRSSQVATPESGFATTPSEGNWVICCVTERLID